tara:strand:+ start:47 stop:217 length:171 start_codon:yes stop_codon:yes gene_type:complete
MGELHFIYYVQNKVLHFRISDGRTGAEPLYSATIKECIERLKIQLCLHVSTTFEKI